MATKTRLERAIERQAAELEDAQRELVLSQFDTYKWNKRRMSEIEVQLKLLDAKGPAEYGGVRTFVQIRKSLTSERNALTTANNSISSKLFMQLKGTGGDADEFDDFMKEGGGDGR